MKFIVLALLALLPSLAWSSTICVDAKPRPAQYEQLVYLGKNHWLTVVDKRLLEFQNDKLISSIKYPEHLGIVCGQEGRVIATMLDEVFEWKAGQLVKLPLSFKGRLSSSDGVVVYSTVTTSLGFVLYVNKKGVSTKILEQAGYSGEMSNGLYIWSNYDKRINLIFRNGKLIRKVPMAKGAYLNYLFDYAQCGTQGLYQAGPNLFIQSRFGVHKLSIDGPIINIDRMPGCQDYLFLFNDFSYTKGALWLLKPGKELTRTPIPTSCPVDHFAANNDGSLYYRCGKQFYYKDSTRTQDIPLGAASNLRLTAGVTDRWMATENDGTLFMFLPESKQGEVQRACVVRLTPKKLVDLGCF